MVTEHTYYVASRDRTFGEHAKDDGVIAWLLDTWRVQRGAGEPTVVDGVSAWLDEQGRVQVRVVKNATSETPQDVELAERIGALLRGPRAE